MGDGIMASFVDAPASVTCAIEIQEELASYNEISEPPIHVRIDIHAGEPVEEGDDLFGSAVQMAARICDIAQADAILYLVRSGMRVLVSIWGLRQRAAKR